MGVGELRPGTAHCMDEHNEAAVVPGAGGGTGQPAMGKGTHGPRVPGSEGGGGTAMSLPFICC